MGRYTDSIAQILQYSAKALPEMLRTETDTAEFLKPCLLQPGPAMGTADEATHAFRHRLPALCAGFFAFHPNADFKSTLSFINSLYTLSDILEAYRSKKNITDESEIRRLFCCLSGAVDPSRGAGCSPYFPAGGAKSLSGVQSLEGEAGKASCLSNHCRMLLATLPSFPLAAQKLKKYMQLYIDMKTYSHCHRSIRDEYLEAWSGNYLKRYHDISRWEFCAASSSLTGIAAMYAAASNPNLTRIDVYLLDEALFPWLNGLESLLFAYISDRMRDTEELCLTSFYKNLKECEVRILFFARRAEEVCMKLKESEFYLTYIKFMTAMFLADTEADFGLKRISSRNIREGIFKQNRSLYRFAALLHKTRFCRCLDL